MYGCDPEFFIINEVNKVVSPALLEYYGFIKPVQDDIKHPVYIDTSEFRFHGDGVAIELGLKKPVKDYKEMYATINNSFNSLQEFVEKINKLTGRSFSLYTKPVVDIDPTEYIPLLDNPKIYMGFIFGCDRDYDAVDTEYNCITLDVENHPYRYGGGHIHISNEKMHKFYRAAIMLMAITVGNFMVRESLYPDLDKLRVLTYGRPFRYRKQTYPNGAVGIEYRSPSNSWCSFSLEKMEQLFYWIDKAIFYIDHEDLAVKLVTELLPSTTDAINTYNQSLSERILEYV
jgi:hypothetical protein